MASILNYIVDLFRGGSLNGTSTNKDLMTLIAEKDISQAMELFQNRDLEVMEAIKNTIPLSMM